MLRKALRKDVLLNARHLWGVLPWFVWVAYVMSEPGAGRMTAVGAAFIGSLMATTLGAREDKFKAGATLASLPVRRRVFVEARYVVAYLMGVATYAVVVAMAAALPWSVQRAAELVDTRTLLLTLTLASGAIAVLMPVVVRFGLMGVLIFLGIFQLLGIALVLAFELFRSTLGRGAIGAIEQGIVRLHRSLDQPAVILQTAAIVAAAVWLSFRLSVFLAERQEL
jgi:hypothetical protein